MKSAGITALLLLIAGTTLCFSIKQNTTRKLLSDSRWNLSKAIDAIGVGDTVIFSKNDTFGLMFASNGSIRKYQIIWYCGNSTRRELRKLRKKQWQGIGKWSVSEENAKTTLKLELSNKDISLERISQSKDSIVFFTSSVKTE